MVNTHNPSRQQTPKSFPSLEQSHTSLNAPWKMKIFIALHNNISVGISCSRGGGIIRKGHLLDPDDVLTLDIEPIIFFSNKKQSVMVGAETTMDGLRGHY